MYFQQFLTCRCGAHVHSDWRAADRASNVTDMPSKLLCVAVAARRGADGFQKHTWMELPAETTLRAVGRSICPDGELLHVEARKHIDGELSEFAGGMLDRDLAFVVGVARMQFLKCCFAVDRVAAEIQRLQQQDGSFYGGQVCVSVKGAVFQ